MRVGAGDLLRVEHHDDARLLLAVLHARDARQQAQAITRSGRVEDQVAAEGVIPADHELEVATATRQLNADRRRNAVAQIGVDPVPSGGVDPFMLR
jgi:hypothetical protein